MREEANTTVNKVGWTLLILIGNKNSPQEIL